MRQIIFALSFILGISTIATAQSSGLTIRFEEPGNYEVVLNQKRYYSTDIFKASQLPSGLYNIQIVKLDYSPYHDKSIKRVVYTGNIKLEEDKRTVTKLLPNNFLKTV